MNAEKVGDLLPFNQRYELREQLWCDGPYRGWQAFDRLLNREVVVNVAYEHFPDVDTFVSRARIRSRLRHPNLKPVYDLGITNENLPFFTEPWIETIDLKQLVSSWEANEQRRPASPLKTAVGYLLAACEAVEFVHHQGYGFVHLNPGRVTIHELFNEVFVTDEIVDPNCTTHEVGRLVGMPAYMAPEQLMGPSWPTAASDVYGLGGILYWILHGVPPNQIKDTTSTLQFLVALTKRKAPPPKLEARPLFADRSVKWQISELQDIARDALELVPDRRTKTILMFKEQLHAWMSRT